MNERKDYDYPWPAPPYASELEKCLAGFMLVCAIRGERLDDDMFAWASERMTGEKRSPLEIWRGIAA